MSARPAGLSVEEAARKLHLLLSEARRRELTGVQLKDETGAGDGLVAGGLTFLL
jgi:ethanolamine ammonia-lyase small subunit